jgi:hypothetical protein
MRRLKRAAYALSLFIVFITSMAIQSLGPFVQAEQYNLDAQHKALLGESRDDTKEFLKLNKEGTAYEFAVPKEETAESKQSHGRKDDVYSASLPVDIKDGVGYTETVQNIDIKLVPKFRVGDGKRIDGDHVVYPFGPNKLIYTLKYNGLKEDIVVPKYTSDQLNYSFELSLPSGVEARLDAQGNIGIYSSDPTLFGNISFGSDEDRPGARKRQQD